MVEKLIAEIYYTYGKGDGEELSERIVIEDTPEARSDLLDEIYYNETNDSEDDFINGKSDDFYFERHGGGWDEPTGGYIQLQSKSDLIREIRTRAEREIERVESLFKGEILCRKKR